MKPVLRSLLPRFALLSALATALLPSLQARSVSVTSPDGRWQVVAETTPQLSLQIGGKGGVLVKQEIGLQLADGRQFAGGSVDPRVQTRSVNEKVRPVAPTKFAEIADHYNEATLDFGDYTVQLRAYDNGVAYRFTTKLQGEIVVAGERSRNTFAATPLVYFGREAEFVSSNEVLYEAKKLSDLAPGSLASLPLLVRTSPQGPLMLFSESGLEKYPGQWMQVGKESASLDGVWPGYPSREEETSDRHVAVRERHPYIAKIAGSRALPWRFVALAAKDGDLLTNQLSYLLAEPSRIADTSWIKPGKVQWDWWHDFNVWDVSFRGGVSQELYLHYIDFAAANGAQHVLLDEGWYKLGDLTKPAVNINVPALVEYARKKNVNILLWMSWLTLQKQMDVVLAQVEKWGVSGLKVDFFDRDDQPMVEFYWKLAAEAAKRKLTLDFHGAHKPAGLLRTFPNVLTIEGVRGAEYNKWSEGITPEHNLTLPFTRMVAGPMDYTPGAMDNAQPEQFRPNSRRPQSRGTRCHQLAMFVVYESPLQMMADSPSAYRHAPESLEFLAQVPSVWDETRVLAGEVGQYVAVARRSGQRWFIGAMANQERTLELDLSFLPAGAKLQVWQDGPNADRDGRDVQRGEAAVAGAPLKIKLAPGGGWVGLAK